jgi:hypothetical protein
VRLSLDDDGWDDLAEAAGDALDGGAGDQWSVRRVREDEAL